MLFTSESEGTITCYLGLSSGETSNHQLFQDIMAPYAKVLGLKYTPKNDVLSGYLSDQDRSV